MGTKWRNEYRRCERCKTEYRPQRRAQSYCSPDCRRQAAYGRERFEKGTKGRRRVLPWEMWEAATDSTENNDIRIDDIDDLSQPMRQPINLPT